MNVDHPFLPASDGVTADQLGPAVKSTLAYPLGFPRVDGYDGVLIYREALPVGPPLLELALGRWSRVPIAYDIDDPIFLRSMSESSVHPVSRWLKDSGRADSIARIADVTICINDLIADRMRPYARNVEVIPNAIDLARYTPRPPPSTDGPCVFGFSGSPSTVSQLLEIRGALSRVAREVPSSLHVVGGACPFRLEQAPVVAVRWTAADELKILQAFDVGLAPAPDEDIFRYKSPVKVLLYMAVGLPVVASPLGMATRIIRHGENGFLASTEQEWADALIELARNPGLRARMGAEARKTIEERFALTDILPRVSEVFGRLLSGGYA